MDARSPGSEAHAVDGEAPAPDADPRIASFHRKSEQCRQAALTRHGRARKLREDDARSRVGDILADEITDEDLIRLAAPDSTPTEAQLRYARAYVTSPPRATLKEIAHTAEVDPATVRRWKAQGGFRVWLGKVATELTGTAVARVWRAMLDRALDGDVRAAKMVFERFDPDFGRLRAEPKRRQESPGSNLDAELAAFKARGGVGVPVVDVEEVDAPAAEAEGANAGRFWGG
ncbi:hypothetical protein LCGC14_1937070 [marine sediment metagenome]|uniref:Uncharacterized protein n=1 Tax=marine sediment metagenome TaxID=412755 RepID=A0A0F9IIU9_9ZZZZ